MVAKGCVGFVRMDVFSQVQDGDQLYQLSRSSAKRWSGRQLVESLRAALSGYAFPMTFLFALGNQRESGRKSACGYAMYLAARATADGCNRCALGCRPARSILRAVVMAVAGV
jgi:hypothetical protein